VRHRLKAAGIDLPVIYITGKDNHATRMAAIESGCIAYLTKPFAAKSLMEPIERASAGFVKRLTRRCPAETSVPARPCELRRID
jgi:FixJ family two-component response regulator